MCERRDIQEELKKVRDLVGPTPEIKVEKFSNWAGTQEQEVLSVSPGKVEEVRSVIRAARELGLRLRAVGTGHSWSPLFSDTGDIVVHVRDLKRQDGEPQIVLSKNPDDPCTKLLTVATGVTTGEVKDFQLSHGFCLLSNVILREVQMGGVVAPACHGVGWDAQTVSDCIVSMRIIDSDGELRTYSIMEDEDMMRAVQCNLGLWGIIVDMTLKVEPMLMVETENVWIKVKDLFYNKDNFKQIIHDNWSVQVLWFPFNSMSSWEGVEAIFQNRVDKWDWDPKEDDVLIRKINKLDISGPAVPSDSYEDTDARAASQATLFKIIDDLIVKHPKTSPLFLHTQMEELKKNFAGTLVQQVPHAIHFRSNIQDVPVQDMEWGFSVDNDISDVCKATQAVVDLVFQAAQEGSFPMNLPLEMRFMADSDVYMAPCSNSNPKYGGTGHTCQIEVLTIAHTPGWQEFCQKVANVWQTLPGARPHWCKEWTFLKDIHQFVRESYADMIPKFRSALERSGADPDRMFFNDLLEQLIYPKVIPETAGRECGQEVNRSTGRPKERQSRLCTTI